MWVAWGEVVGFDSVVWCEWLSAYPTFGCCCFEGFACLLVLPSVHGAFFGTSFWCVACLFFCLVELFGVLFASCGSGELAAVYAGLHEGFRHGGFVLVLFRVGCVRLCI